MIDAIYTKNHEFTNFMLEAKDKLAKNGRDLSRLELEKVDTDRFNKIES
jgi:hypothetical protein